MFLNSTKYLQNVLAFTVTILFIPIHRNRLNLKEILTLKFCVLFDNGRTKIKNSAQKINRR